MRTWDGSFMSPKWDEPEKPKKSRKKYGSPDFNEISSGGGLSPEEKKRRKKKKN